MKCRDNKYIEACRFFACIMITFTHVPFPSPYGNYVGAYARFAVPLYLMISGYFCYGDNIVEKSRKKLRDTIRIIVVGGAICLIWNCFNSFLRYGSIIQWANSYMNVKTLLEFVVFNRAVFINSVFYYLFMLCYIYILAMIFRNYVTRFCHMLLPAAIVLTITGWVINHFSNLPWYYVGNVLFTGIPMFLIGQHLRATPAAVNKAMGHEVMLIIIGILLTLAEYHFTRKGNYVFFGQVLIAGSILCYCLNHSGSSVFKPIAFLGSSCSLYIMIIHCEIRDTLSLFMNKDTWLFPVVVLFISTVVALIGALIKRYISIWHFHSHCFYR